jgi:hypothetical protein
LARLNNQLLNIRCRFRSIVRVPFYASRIKVLIECILPIRTGKLMCV